MLSKRYSVEILSHSISLCCNGVSADAIPISLTPRRMNGNTNVSNLVDSTIPQLVTTPLSEVARSIVDKVLPPTLSIAAIQRLGNSPLPLWSFTSER